jgi:hypothetical protein
MAFSPVGKTCSFCGVVGTASTQFAGGLGALMCKSCIDRYHEILSTPEKRERVRRPWYQEMDDETALATLPKILATATQVEDYAREWVGVLRDRGLSWADIGRSMGVSRQAAWQRFSQSKVVH